MKEFIRKNLLIIIFSTAGAIGGLLYWKFVGCISGTCPIKSVWYLSTLFGLFFGYAAGGLMEEVIVKFKKQKKHE
ncbi:MAG TPA: DUF6132 family protein [Anaerovoracaceae bacterium]|nr:DUF6132 family protein [Anaerovoracaceae bacterium]